MALADDLKLIVARDRWAMEDLCYDEATKDWNRLHNSASNKAKIEFLKYEGGFTVVAVLNQAKALLSAGRTPVVVNSGSLKQDLLLIAKQYGWVFDELILEHQERICLELFKSANSMWQYLSKKIGSGEAALAQLKYLVQHQHGRRKTLHLICT
jgi:hypothetical protein